MGNVQRNVVYNVALSLSQVLFPLLVFPYVSRVLGPLRIGEVAFVDSITQGCVLVAALGIPLYGVREIAKVKDDPDRRSAVFSELWMLHVLATLVVSFVFILSFNTINGMASYRYLFWVGAGILFLQSSLVEWLFQGMGQFSYITWRTIAVRVAITVAVFLWVKGPDDTTRYYALTLFGIFANVLLNGLYVRKFVRFKGLRLNLRRHIRPLFYIFAFAIVTSVYTLLDATILGFMVDKTEVGYYSTAMRLVKLVTTLLVALSMVMVATLSSSFHQGRKEEAYFLLRKSFALTVFAGIPMALGLIVIAPNIIALFAGGEFDPAVPALRLLAPTILAIGLSSVFGMQVLNTTNNERLFLYAALVGMVISVVGNLALIPLFRAVGTAVTNLFTELIVCVVLAIFALRRFPFRPAWPLLGKAVLAALPIPFIRWQLSHFGLSVLGETLATVVLAMLVYMAIQRFVWKNPLVDELIQIALPTLGRHQKEDESDG